MITINDLMISTTPGAEFNELNMFKVTLNPKCYSLADFNMTQDEFEEWLKCIISGYVGTGILTTDNIRVIGEDIVRRLNNKRQEVAAAKLRTPPGPPRSQIHNLGTLPKEVSRPSFVVGDVLALRLQPDGGFALWQVTASYLGGLNQEDVIGLKRLDVKASSHAEETIVPRVLLHAAVGKLS